jgi:hypothetical protein
VFDPSPAGDGKSFAGDGNGLSRSAPVESNEHENPDMIAPSKINVLSW